MTCECKKRKMMLSRFRSARAIMKALMEGTNPNAKPAAEGFINWVNDDCPSVED